MIFIDTGLNPLIYTISAVVLLGTLAIVAIVTCWIRARRSYNRRMFQSTTNPQDYLDYISDNEFTPLTTSEFVASLQERPPTYHESEEIEEQMKSEDDDGNEQGSGASRRSTNNGAQTTRARVPPSRPLPPVPSDATTTNSDPTGSQLPGEATLVVDLDRPSAFIFPTLDDGSEGASLDDASGDTFRVDRDAPHTVTSPGEQAMDALDALLSLDVGNGNGTRQEARLEPHVLPSQSSAATGTLIEIGNSDSTGSDSQSTFHGLPQPTQEQINEIEAAIGAINKHMTEIRERTE